MQEYIMIAHGNTIPGIIALEIGLLHKQLYKSNENTVDTKTKSDI